MDAAIGLPAGAGQREQARPRRRRLRKAKDFLASYIPFTESFARHARREVRKEMELFRGLSGLSAEARRELEDRVDDAEMALARMELRMRATIFLVLTFSVGVFIPYSFVELPQFVVERFGPLLQPGTLLARHTMLFVVVTAFVAVLAGAALAWGRRRASARFAPSTITGIDAAVMAVAAAYLAYGSLNAWSVSSDTSPALYLAVLTVCGVFYFAATVTVTWLVVERSVRLYRARACSLHPEAVVVHELLTVLSRLEEGADSRRWLELEVRRELLERLERTALCLEHAFPRRLRHDDLATDAWLRGRTGEIAAWVREMKRGLCLPRAETRAEMAASVATALEHAARGNWDLMRPVAPPPVPAAAAASSAAPAAAPASEAAAAPAAEPTAEPKPKRRTWLWVAVRVAGFAAAAALVVMVVKESPAGLTDVLKDVAGGVYEIIIPLLAPLLAYTLLRALNPSLLQTLPTIRDVGKKG